MEDQVTNDEVSQPEDKVSVKFAKGQLVRYLGRSVRCRAMDGHSFSGAVIKQVDEKIDCLVDSGTMTAIRV